MKRIIQVTGVLVLVVSSAAWYWWPRPAPAALRLPGVVELQEVRLGSRIGGRVAVVCVRDGDSVEPGQVLVRFEADDLLARRDQARHRVSIAQAAWEKASHGPLPEEVSEAKAAADVARARLRRVTIGSRDEEKRKARSELDSELVVLRKADDDFRRHEGLTAVSDQELQAVRASRDRAKSRANTAQAALDLANGGGTKEEIDEAKADWERFEARHKLMVRGTREEDKAAAYASIREAEAKLAEAETAVREATVVAPERCVVEVVSVRAGDIVPAGQPVVRVLRSDDLWVKAYVPSTELGKVRIGQLVEVSVDSHPNRRFVGKLSHIASVSEFTPRNVQSLDERKHQVYAVRVTIAEPEGVFKSGMAAEVFLTVSQGN